ISMVSDLLGKAGIPLPPQPLASLDDALTQVLGHSATVKGEILSWLGPQMAFGVRVPDTLFDAALTGGAASAGNTKLPNPEFVVITTVTDEARADAFLKELLALTAKTSLHVTQTQDQIGSDTVTIYSDPQLGPVRLARWKGYLAFGNLTWPL